MSTERATIEAFYTGFQSRDHVAMADCYHADVHFSDPVFPDLRGDEARAMWHMLCAQGDDLDIGFSDVVGGDGVGSARWVATYTFGPASRLVRNEIDASFEFRDGKIIRHVDDFDLWRWTRMALGPVGVLTGWTPLTQNRVRATAGRSLVRFIEKNYA